MSTQEKIKEPSLSTLLTMKEVGISVPENPATKEEISTWVRVLVNNWHQGTVGVKGRADVSLTGKKPWKQKGTGRARAGTARSPLWRGGGVVFGPQAKDTTWRVNKNTRKRVLATIIADYIKNKKALLADWELKDKPSTAQAAALIKKLGLANTKVILFLPADDAVTAASFANIPNVHALCMDQLNAYDLLVGAQWIVLKKDLNQFKEMVAQWQ